MPFAMLASTTALALLAGCASPGGADTRLVWRSDELPAGQRLVWPPPPEPARYVYAGSLRGSANLLSPAASRLRAFGRWLAGLDEQDTADDLVRPAALMVDAAGRVFVSDVGRQAVVVFDAAAGRVQRWDQAEGLTRFAAPAGLAPAPTGGVYVADAQLGAVFELGPEGEPRRRIGQGLLRRPTGLARDPASGRLFVADTQAHCIQVFAADGRHLATLGGPGEAPGRFNAPAHLAFARGELYVTDTFNQRVQVLGGPGLAGAGELHVRTLGRRGLQLGDLVRPKGVAVDSAGRVYVVESYHDSLLVYAPDGDFLLPIGAGAGAGALVTAGTTEGQATPAQAPAEPGGASGSAGRFYLPAGLWIDGQDHVYLADMFRGRVVRLDPVGTPASAPTVSAAPR